MCGLDTACFLVSVSRNPCGFSDSSHDLRQGLLSSFLFVIIIVVLSCVVGDFSHVFWWEMLMMDLSHFVILFLQMILFIFVMLIVGKSKP